MHAPTNTPNRTHAQLNSASTPKVGSNRAAFDRLLSNEQTYSTIAGYRRPAKTLYKEKSLPYTRLVAFGDNSQGGVKVPTGGNRIA